MNIKRIFTCEVCGAHLNVAGPADAVESARRHWELGHFHQGPDAPPAAMRAGLVDYGALHIGGMPAFEQALRDLEAGYLELSDRLAAHLADEALADEARAHEARGDAARTIAHGCSVEEW